MSITVRPCGIQFDFCFLIKPLVNNENDNELSRLSKETSMKSLQLQLSNPISHRASIKIEIIEQS